ncbi:hypothetical protein KX928_12800 [Roseobacter sp. YSTF-M11]|uniref:Uncharacterized protein n=1 Tax=Roseobacter insulae TaxID=2859783 RepID=A0A9X1FWI8_9RHOB|nr:hypothetical protein [Roseobacter insulae]MBW4708664.1 hypothetical protein [Roseobacter insulae]
MTLRRPDTAAETVPVIMDLPVSATCAGEASQHPSPAPFQQHTLDQIDSAFDLPERKGMGDLPWTSFREFAGDVIGAACVFLIPIAFYFIGALLQ